MGGMSASTAGSIARSPSVVNGATANSASPTRRYTAWAPTSTRASRCGPSASSASSRTRRAIT